jgi:glycosyltransferase involved in cell wall biosynthesis
MTILSYHNVKAPHTSAHSLLTMQTSLDLSRIADVYYYANRGGGFPEFKTIYGFDPAECPSLHLRITRNSYKSLASVEKRAMALKDIISLRHDRPVVYVTQIKPLRFFLGLKKLGFGIKIMLEPHSEAEGWDTECFAGVDGIIYTTRALRRRLMEKYSISSDIPNRVFYHRIRTSLTEGITERSAKAGYRIGYIGGLEAWKGVDTIVEALSLLPDDVTAHFIGCSIGSSDYARLTSVVKRLGLERRTLFTERVPQADIPKAAEDIDVFILPLLDSSQGSLPMKLFDYMLLRRPVIASDQESIREVVNDDSALFFRPGSAKELAEQVLNLVRDRQLGACLSTNAFESLKLHTVETWLNNMKEFLGEIV